MAPAPNVVVGSPYGDVFADSAPIADDVAVDLARLVPEIRALLPGTRDSAPDVWIQRELLLFVGWPVHESVGGFAVTRGTWLHWWTGDRIHVQETSPQRRRLFLAHELVHCVIDDTWHALPPAVEEGLCDEVAMRVEPEHGPHHRGVLMLAAGLATGHLPIAVEYRRSGHVTRRLALDPTPGVIDPAEALSAGYEAVKGTSGLDGMKRRGVGFVVVGRIVEAGGFAALRRLAEDSRARGERRIAASGLLDSARLFTENDWREAIDARVGPGELEAMAAEIGEEVGRRTAPMAAYDHRGWSAERFLAESDVMLVYGFGADAIEVPLGDVDEYRRGILEAWPGAENDI